MGKFLPLCLSLAFWVVQPAGADDSTSNDPQLDEIVRERHAARRARKRSAREHHGLGRSDPCATPDAPTSRMCSRSFRISTGPVTRRCPRYFQLRRHRRAGAISGRAQPFGGISHRRRRLQRSRHRGHSCTTSTRSMCCADPRPPATARMRWAASFTCAARNPPTRCTAASTSTAAITGTRSEGGVISGPVDSLDSGFRLAAQHYYTNGYYHNLYLNRDDTNRQDEYTYRAKWAFTPSERLRIELTAMQVDIDNGYDAYAIDNSRNTESDQPGVDSQHSTGVSLRAHYLPSDTPRDYGDRRLCQVYHRVQL